MISLKYDVDRDKHMLNEIMEEGVEPIDFQVNAEGGVQAVSEEVIQNILC